MSQDLVVDASVVVAALVDRGADGRWSEERLTGGPLFAPQLLPVEVANILRRAEAVGDLSPDTAALAHADLLDLRVELLGYQPFAARIWELRTAVTADDAWYVAVAEALDLPLATLDARLSRSPGPSCRFLLPPS